MGRKSEFNRETALKNATELFWKQGYVNTSMKQLLSVMKIGEGSFYNSFKSKKELYKECIDFYNNTFMKKRSDALREGSSAKERLFSFFDVVIDDLDSNKVKSCLMANSVAGDVFSETDLRKSFTSDIEGFIEYISSIVEEGVSAGEFKVKDSQSAGQVIYTYLFGLQKLSVMNFDAGAKKNETRIFLNSILSP